MFDITLITMGKLKEPFYISAASEYAKRLGAYCRFELTELAEVRLPDAPSQKEIAAALEKEATGIVKSIPTDAYTVALCVEGRQMPSEKLAELIARQEGSGKPRLCFIIGGSFGLSPRVKDMADLRLSMSEMTFPHHLARVMLMEQIYRGFKINEGSKYHK